MFRKSGHHFSEENMLQINKLGAKSDSTKSDFALAPAARQAGEHLPDDPLVGWFFIPAWSRAAKQRRLPQAGGDRRQRRDVDAVARRLGD